MTGPAVAVVVAVAVLVVVAAVVGLLVARRRGRALPKPHAPTSDAAPTMRRAAVIINPTKFSDVDGVRDQIARACRRHGWAPPLFLETTAEDSGGGQAHEALEGGTDLVCALGGDGTVREVAATLVATGVPMALLPAGTGNLLARNLHLPVNDLDDALEVALTGRDHAIDVGHVTFDLSGEDERPPERVFLVMAGMGFDAAMMAGAPEALKARVGWLAYVVSGARNLLGEEARARIVTDDDREYRRRVRTVLVANCGTLTGGIQLLPDAEVDDGWLDSVSLSPKGIVSWATMAARLLTGHRHRRVDRARCRTISVRVDRPTPAQLDGDVVGTVRAMRARVEPGALVVRLPRT